MDNGNIIKVTGAGAFVLSLAMLALILGVWGLIALVLAWIVGITFLKAALLALVVIILARVL